MNTPPLEFLAELSHKLRTPMTAIKSFAELLLKYPDETPAQRKEFAQIIFDEVQKLQTLLSQQVAMQQNLINGNPPSPSTTPNLVMIVDDDKQLIKSLGFFLEKQKYPQIVAESISDAQQQLQHRQPAVIFLDIFLPDGNGYDFCEKLKLAQPNRPVFLMSANKADKDRLRAMTVKADGFIAKPFAFEEVLAALHNACR